MSCLEGAVIASLIIEGERQLVLVLNQDIDPAEGTMFHLIELHPHPATRTHPDATEREHLEGLREVSCNRDCCGGHVSILNKGPF